MTRSSIYFKSAMTMILDKILKILLFGVIIEFYDLPWLWSEFCLTTHDAIILLPKHLMDYISLINKNGSVTDCNGTQNNSIETRNGQTCENDRKILCETGTHSITEPGQRIEKSDLVQREIIPVSTDEAQVDPCVTRAMEILNKYFKGREFDFERFATLSDIEIDQNHKPHSDFIKRGFDRIHYLITEFLKTKNGIVIEKEKGIKISINITSEDIINANNSIDHKEKMTEEDIAYKLYSHLTESIAKKLLDSANDPVFATHCFPRMISDGFYLYGLILTLPLVNMSYGMQLCAAILQAETEAGEKICNTVTDLTAITNFDETIHPEGINYAKEFHKLGICFVFEDGKLAKELLPAAKFVTSIGMPTPQFIAEIATNRRLLGMTNLSGSGVVINKLVMAPFVQWLENKIGSGFSVARLIFYHENIHHVRVLAEADFELEKSLTKILKNQDDIISAIRSQLGCEALMNQEEYIAAFGAYVLCCLDQGKNPFDYIKDERLWRLYYEFGGPDFTQKINEIINSIPNCPKHDILEDVDHCYSHLSGYPSKFGINITKIKDKQIKVNELVDKYQAISVDINEKTILPPPPLGYCYTTEKGRLQLKIDKSIDVLKDSTDNTLYDPVFCSLTDGPLTLMKTSSCLVDHFEALPSSNNKISIKQKIWDKLSIALFGLYMKIFV